MQKYKIVVSDLDGTLLNSKKEVSKENLEAIRSLKEKGIPFVASSGRARSEMPDIDANPDVRYLSCSNGAVIYDKETGEAYRACLSKELSDYVFDVLASYETYIVFHHDGKSYLDTKKHTPEWLMHCRVSPYFAEAIEPLAYKTDDILKLGYSLDNIEMYSVFFHDDKEFQECQEKLLATGKLLVTPTFKCSLEIFSIDAGKGNGLKYLADILGCDIAETIAMGDSPNDITMLEAAGLGLAMENADEEVKAVADEVICHHDEHGVAYVLSHYFE